ncbi:MAG: hypothetical protein NTU61_03865 [Candidatus Altiarchaeota archaeon]|nr:hypothetical protein [Candidatus Altiarchaeota archaeon]
MAAKNKVKKPKKTAKKVSKAKTTVSKKPVKAVKAPKLRYKASAVHGKKLKCCVHCQDYEQCDDKGNCCEYCDFLIKGKCNYRRNKEILSADKENIEIGDYRGDDYGIDDYEEYEDMFES